VFKLSLTITQNDDRTPALSHCGAKRSQRSRQADIGDVALIAGAWRATDAASLADYDFNDNNVVDTADIMTVAAHLGQPCP